MKVYATKRSGLIFLIGAFVTAWVCAEDVPLKNWPAPSWWSPPKAHGLTTQSETNPLPFIGITPCRQYDSRNFTPLPTNTVREVVVRNAPCGVPVSAAAVSLNVTVFDILGQTSFAVFQVGTSNNPTTGWINYPVGQGQIANAGVLPLSDVGSLFFRVQQGAGSIDFLIDVNGYYPLTTTQNPLATGESFGIAGNVNAASVISGTNASTTDLSAGISGAETATSGKVFGVVGQSASTTTGSAGIEGVATSTTGATYGVLGQVSSTSSSAAGVRGVTLGTTGQTYAVLGENGSTTAGAAGVRGRASGSTGATYGVLGENSSTTNESAGVKGFDSGGALPTVVPNVPAGVRGDSALGVGVFGFSRSTGVAGTLLDTPGNILAAGYLGYVAGNYGVYANGDIGATGMKFFVEPHPTDASKVIRYVALEGPEAGTYFRGSARTVHGRAVIEVPESFRIVTAEEGLTVQLTPIGALVTLAVMNKDLRAIEVRSSRDSDFDYEVKGLRRAFRNFQPTAESGEFIPESSKATLPSYLNEEARRRLIQNGTYNPDGSVNLGTAQRLGWLKVWEEREDALARANAGR